MCVKPAIQKLSGGQNVGAHKEKDSFWVGESRENDTEYLRMWEN
jgi:hypothetical protein